MGQNSLSCSTPTTAQSLGALLKSARDIMRKAEAKAEGEMLNAKITSALGRWPLALLL